MTQPITVAGERAFLTKHLDYMARQPWIDECYAEMRQLLAQLKATNGTAQPKPIARCYLPSIDGPCDGPIRVDDGYAYCATCRQTWTAEQVPALLEQIHEMSRPRTEDGRVMMTVEQIVATYGLRANAVRVRLSRAGVKGMDGYYDTTVFEGVVA